MEPVEEIYVPESTTLIESLYRLQDNWITIYLSINHSTNSFRILNEKQQSYFEFHNKKYAARWWAIANLIATAAAFWNSLLNTWINETEK